MKENGNREIMVASWYPKNEEFKKFCFLSRKIQAFICFMLDEQFVETFFSSFHLHPGHKNNMEENLTQQWICLYGEADGANFISVENWIHKLWLFIQVPVGFSLYKSIILLSPGL